MRFTSGAFTDRFTTPHLSKNEPLIIGPNLRIWERSLLDLAGNLSLSLILFLLSHSLLYIRKEKSNKKGKNYCFGKLLKGRSMEEF